MLVHRAKPEHTHRPKHPGLQVSLTYSSLSVKPMTTTLVRHIWTTLPEKRTGHHLKCHSAGKRLLQELYQTKKRFHILLRPTEEEVPIFHLSSHCPCELVLALRSVTGIFTICFNLNYLFFLMNNIYISVCLCYLNGTYCLLWQISRDPVQRWVPEVPEDQLSGLFAESKWELLIRTCTVTCIRSPCYDGLP